MFDGEREKVAEQEPFEEGHALDVYKDLEEFLNSTKEGANMEDDIDSAPKTTPDIVSSCIMLLLYYLCCNRSIYCVVINSHSWIFTSKSLGHPPIIFNSAFLHDFLGHCPK